MKVKYPIIYQDEHLIVINKLPHLLSVPDRYRADKPNIQEYLHQKYGRIYPVHRLDKETSGVICFAKSHEAFIHLSRAFESRNVSKIYLGLVTGVPALSEGIIDHPLLYDTQIKRTRPDKKGKVSITRYRILESFSRFALLELRILTGRTHQIRANVQLMGHPLIVDKMYGGQDSFFLSQIKSSYKKKDKPERALISRVPLHASKLTVPPLVSDVTYSWEAPLPKDMKAVLAQLRKQSVVPG